jgi:hypothetical protein
MTSTPAGSTVDLDDPDDTPAERREERLSIIVAFLSSEHHLLGTATTVGKDDVPQVNAAGRQKVARAEALADYLLARMDAREGAAGGLKLAEIDAE